MAKFIRLESDSAIFILIGSQSENQSSLWDIHDRILGEMIPVLAENDYAAKQFLNESRNSIQSLLLKSEYLGDLNCLHCLMHADLRKYHSVYIELIKIIKKVCRE